MLFATWFTVDEIYWIYRRFMNPAALQLRDANFLASLSLYGYAASSGSTEAVSYICALR